MVQFQAPNEPSISAPNLHNTACSPLYGCMACNKLKESISHQQTINKYGNKVGTVNPCQCSSCIDRSSELVNDSMTIPVKEESYVQEIIHVGSPYRDAPIVVYSKPYQHGRWMKFKRTILKWWVSKNRFKDRFDRCPMCNQCIYKSDEEQATTGFSLHMLKHHTQAQLPKYK